MPGSPVFDALTQRYLYRMHDGGTHTYARPTIVTSAYPVIRETAKCYVIPSADGKGDKFILKDPTGKRFAYLNLADAQNSYRVRKLRQAQIYAARHDRAQEYLVEIKRQISGEPPESESLFFAPPAPAMNRRAPRLSADDLFRRLYVCPNCERPQVGQFRCAVCNFDIRAQAPGELEGEAQPLVTQDGTLLWRRA